MGARDVARAIDALRRGWPVAVDDISFLAIETADAEGLAAFDGDGAPAALLISGNRAATLKLTNQREALPTEPVLIRRAPWIDLDAATAIADPALDLAHPLKGPFQTAPLCSPPTARGGAAAGAAGGAAAGLVHPPRRPRRGARRGGRRHDVRQRRRSAHRLARAPAQPLRRARPRSSPSAPTATRPSMSR